MTYDNYGNILTKNGVPYVYGDPVWKDLLTSVDGLPIGYDEQGNPTSYLGHTLTWEKGRQLKSYDNNTYTYNANGIRTSKTINGVKHTYVVDDTKIIRETWGNNELVPIYDNEDAVCGIRYNNVPYYFIKNLQGDVIAIADKDATIVARYSYDAWGVPTITADITACNIATINPFRYRSYYYDDEIDLYYLQSRYYDPVIGRFVNADKSIGANDDHSTYALYTYCGNCPVDRCDSLGSFWKKIWNGIKKAVRTLLNKTNKVLVSVGIDTAAMGAYLLNMKKDAAGVYHANFDCWQQYFGYNNLYDFIFDIGTSMKSAKFPFSCEGKSYILWAWKGNYINLGAGAELGIYYGGEPHWLVDKNLAQNMSMVLKYRGKKIISYCKKTWWITGFNPKYLDAKASDLSVKFTVAFTKDSLYRSFKSAWRKKWSCNDENRTIIYSF